MDRNMDSTLVLVLEMVLDEDVALALEEGMDVTLVLAMAMVLALVLGEDVVRTQGHLDRGHHPRGEQ